MTYSQCPLCFQGFRYETPSFPEFVASHPRGGCAVVDCPVRRGLLRSLMPGAHDLYCGGCRRLFTVSTADIPDAAVWYCPACTRERSQP